MTKRNFTARNTSALLERVEDVPDSVKALLKMSRNSFEMFESIQKQLVQALRNKHDPRAGGKADEHNRRWGTHGTYLGFGDR